jgi:glycosyltransferase involved in cell wall biosynthesis
MTRVAVCTASYNRARDLPEMLESLIAQTFQDFTLYLVYDGSTDNTEAILELYQDMLPMVIVDYQPTARVGLNKNRAVGRALQGDHEYIQMIDADDKVLPRFLEAGVERLDQGDVDWVITWGRLFDQREGYIHSEMPTVDDLLQNNNKLHSWAMFKRGVLERFNFDPSLANGADWGVWLRTIDAGYQGAIIEEELYLKRWHRESITVTEPSSHNELHEWLRGQVLTASGFEIPPRNLRFHLLGLVHLPVSERYMSCAFTQKILKLSKMLLSLGHHVILYGAEGSDAPCSQFVETHTLSDIRREWGDGDNRFEIGYDWESEGFRHDFNKERTPTTQKFYAKCIDHINRYHLADDFLLVMQGVYHKPIADGTNLWLTCEPGIGYRGSYAKYRAFESAYLQNFTYGSENPKQSINGSWYDRVIPNYFDAKDFPFHAEKEDWFFFIGRMIQRKGVDVAMKTCQAIGARIVLAGQGDYDIWYDKAKFIGHVGPEERADLMGRARAVFVPTLYLEAFGGVNVEAQLCGTPVITTDFGVFPETVIQGVTGFRCNTLQDFVTAARSVHKLNPEDIRLHAEKYLMDNVRWRFDGWFRDLYQLYRSFHEKGVPGWHHYE